MNALRFTRQVLLHLLKTLAYGWVLDALDILKRFWAVLRAFWAVQHLPHPVREEWDPDCQVIDNPSFHRPDPCIYSQSYLLKLGLAVTWDNPDIVLRKGGIVVPEHDLQPDTDYEIEATIWNNSYEAPVVGLKVAFAFLTFGVATAETPIGVTYVDLGVKGGPKHPAPARMPWRTPPLPGHYCIQVKLEWIDDANPENNLGQNNVDVAQAHSPATFGFRLRNAGEKRRDYRFEVDTYTIPAAPVCPTSIPEDESGPLSLRLRRIRARHDRANHPVPAGWGVAITPPLVSLDPDDAADITVAITPPAGFTGRMPFNVNAAFEGGHAGGVSLVVEAA